GILYIFEKESKIIKFNLIGGIINIGTNLILYFLGLFNPTTAIITLGTSFLFLRIMMRINVRKTINHKLALIDKDILKYMVVSLSVVVIDYFISNRVTNFFIRLIMIFGVFGIIYSVLLFSTTNDILLLNYKVIKNKIKS